MELLSNINVDGIYTYKPYKLLKGGRTVQVDEKKKRQNVSSCHDGLRGSLVPRPASHATLSKVCGVGKGVSGQTAHGANQGNFPESYQQNKHTLNGI